MPSDLETALFSKGFIKSCFLGLLCILKNFFLFVVCFLFITYLLVPSACVMFSI